MVTVGHSCDITPLLMSLALSKGLDIGMTEGAVIIGVVVTDSTDVSWFASTMGNLTVNLIMPP